MPHVVHHIPAALRDAFVLLKQNNPLILASSTAFFATFSLSPIIIILVNVFGIYFKTENISDELFLEMQAVFGWQTTKQIESMVDNFRALNTATWITLAGSAFLIFIATTLLSVTKQNIHQLWHIKEKQGHKIAFTLMERLIGIVMILSIGLLFTASLVLDTSLAILHDYMHDIIPSGHTGIVRLIQALFSIIVVTTWFSVLFKMLPDAFVHWKVAIAGGLLTGILFTLGKYILGRFLVYGKVATIFGTSTSIALLLLFIFYSSMIIYYGASFTYTFGKVVNKPVRAGKRGDEYEVKMLRPDR